MKDPTPNTGNKEYNESKHCLMTTIYNMEGSLALLPLRDQISQICHANKSTQAEKMINVLNEKAINLNKTTDVINQVVEFSKSHKLGQFDRLLVLRQYSEETIHSLARLARESGIGMVTTTHFIPHTYEIKKFSRKVEELSQTLNLQTVVRETHIRMNQATHQDANQHNDLR